MNNKYIITCLLSLGLFFNAVSQQINYEDPKEQKRIAQGLIKSSVGIGYAYDKMGKRKPAGYKETMEMFDKKGMLNQYIIYKDNQIKERWAFRYNKNGLKTDARCSNGKEELIEKFKITYKGKNPILKKGEKNKVPYEITYEYKNNQLLEEIKFVNGTEIYRHTYIYDAKRNAIKKEFKKKEFVITTNYIFDNNLLISEKIYVNDSLEHYKNYTYNDKKEKYKEIKYDNHGKEISTYTYFYTSDGKVQKVAFYNPGLGYEECSWTYTYDGNGSVSKIFTYSSKKDLNSNKKPVYVTENTYRYFPKKK